jgi:hypothetical protein
MDAVSGDGHVINSATANQMSPLLAKICKSINFTLTQIPSKEEKILPAHTEYDEKEIGLMRHTNTLSATNQFPEVSYSFKEQMVHCVCLKYRMTEM